MFRLDVLKNALVSNYLRFCMRLIFIILNISFILDQNVLLFKGFTLLCAWCVKTFFVKFMLKQFPTQKHTTLQKHTIFKQVLISKFIQMIIFIHGFWNLLILSHSMHSFQFEIHIRFMGGGTSERLIFYSITVTFDVASFQK